MAKELYVGHISEQATEDDLRKLFSLMGPVTSVHLIVDQETGEFKRCGYVRMLASVDLKEAVETLDGTWLIDRCIVVSIAKPQKDRPAKTAHARRKPGITASRNPAGDPSANKRPALSKRAPTTENIRPEKTSRPSAAKNSARGERPAHAARASKGGSPSPGRKPGSTPRPPSRGRS